ncbi:MAG: serine/threonine protein kinase [Planctomycetota bacterium]|nr:MAG: serine/threonine protein kinase [Planctomycetota bacterium]
MSMPTDLHSNERLTRETLRERLEASSLLASDELVRASKWLDGQPSEFDSFWAAKSLATQGWLTPFQARVLCEGRLNDLHIGNYDVLDRLGSGGMGTVFKARHRRMKRVVAIKVLSANFTDNKPFVQRFQREVETVARLAHPNIVTAHDADVCESGHYLVMEFIDGTDLDRLVRLRGSLSPRFVATLVLQAARGLEYAHSQGVIHRDIKPANLVLDSTGVLKITDLGLVRSTDLFEGADSQESSLTKSGGILGTVDYMPPEQAFNPSQVDQRADIYSLGCTLFFLVMARPPYGGETPMETLLLHKQESIPSLLNLHGNMPYELDDLYKRMVAKLPDERFATMSLVIRALERSGLPLADAEITAELKQLRISELVSSPKDSPKAPPRQVTPTVKPSPTATVRDRQSLTVLVADGSLTARVHLRNTLMSLGFTQVTDVSDGEKALEALAARTFDLVVTGLNLSRIDGQGVIEHVRQSPTLARTPVLLVTTESAPAKLDALRRVGASAIIDKSFRADEVRAVLDPLFPTK